MSENSGGYVPPDRALFLGLSEGILTKYPSSRAENPLPVVPLLEEVYVPSVSAYPEELYGGDPRKLLTVSVVSGAALTFFCHCGAPAVSEDDAEGNGSFENPWRSMHTASQFLSCNACVLRRAAKYIQLYVKGTVDVGDGETWDPYPGGPYMNLPYDTAELILRGWSDTRVDLGGGNFGAQYLVNISGRGIPERFVAAQNCTLVDFYATRYGISGGAAVSCDIIGGGRMGYVYRCTATAPYSADVCYEGSFTRRLTVNYAYAPKIDVAADSRAVFVGRAMANGSVTCSVGITFPGSVGGVSAVGVDCSSGAILVNCDVTVTASGAAIGSAAEALANARLITNDNPGVVIAGGRWTATAWATASGGVAARASAFASGFDSAFHTLHNVSTTLTVSAGARISTPDGYESEYEATKNLGVLCYSSRWREYSAGSSGAAVLVSASATSSCYGG